MDSAPRSQNVILGNVKAVTLHDSSNVSAMDLAAHFYLSPADIGANRASSCLKHLQELNPNTDVNASSGELSNEILDGFDVVVCIGTPLAEAIRIDRYCRTHDPPIQFLRTEARGLCGSVFADFGPAFEVNDPDGEPCSSAIVESIEKGAPAEVKCIFEDDGRHELQDGDLVEFTEVAGMTELNSGQYKVTVKNPYSFTIEDTSGFSTYTRGGIVHQIKQAACPKFKSLEESLSSPGPIDPKPGQDMFLESDFSKMFGGRSMLLHLTFQALDKFAANHGGNLPAPTGPADLEHADTAELIAAVNALNSALPEDTRVEVDNAFVAKFAHGSRAVINPICAILGGFVGQEVVKALTGKFHPLHQWFHFDAFETLPTDALPAEEYALTGSRYDANILVFGKSFQQQLNDSSFFLVGAGALGCELIKNLALMGASCGKGNLTITDDDVIERSNLSRQFLFRNWHVGQHKSVTAADAAKAMNQDFNVKSLQERVGPETEDIFNTEFWESQTAIINALDNVKARLYVDQRCVFFEKALLESGTLGTKCNVQVVLPHQTENYGASVDPPEKEAPQCTIHNFPHNIDHTLVWARSEFVGNFETFPADTQKYMEKGRDFGKSMLASGAVPMDVLQCLRGDSVWGGGVKDIVKVNRCKSFEDCMRWALLKFNQYNNHIIRQLVHNFPADAKNSKSGKPFWAPPKRFPTALDFDAADPMHMSFLVAATNLRAHTFGIKPPEGVDARDTAYFASTVAGIELAPWAPKEGIKIQEDPDDDAHVAEERPEKALEQILEALPTTDELKTDGFTVHANEFEKDDDTNFHMDFIWSLANLRARSYGIQEVEKLQAKLKAGRIIPAIATTTAMVTGFVMLELCKLMNKKGFEDFRNTFANLALPLFQMAEPIAPLKSKSRSEKRCPDPINNPDYIEEEDVVCIPDGFTAWDKLVVDEGDLTLQEFIDYFKKKYNVNTFTVVINGKILYTMGSRKERLPKKISELAVEVGKVDISHENFLMPVANFMTEENEDVETPDIVFKFRQ